MITGKYEECYQCRYVGGHWKNKVINENILKTIILNFLIYTKKL